VSVLRYPAVHSDLTIILSRHCYLWILRPIKTIFNVAEIQGETCQFIFGLSSQQCPFGIAVTVFCLICPCVCLSVSLSAPLTAARQWALGGQLRGPSYKRRTKWDVLMSTFTANAHGLSLHFNPSIGETTSLPGSWYLRVRHIALLNATGVHFRFFIFNHQSRPESLCSSCSA